MIVGKQLEEHEEDIFESIDFILNIDTNCRRSSTRNRQIAISGL